MNRRVVVVVALAGVAAISAAVVLAIGSRSDSLGGAPTQDEMAAAVGAPPMQLIVRGHVPGVSGEIALVPRPHRFIGSNWDLSTFNTEAPEVETSHPNPWDYLVKVPLVVYAPGRVAAGEIDRPVDLTSMAPTYAEMIGVHGLESDGRPLREVAEADPPLVIATIVIDGGGWNVLERHPDAWPQMRRLFARATVYTNATVGSAPTVTAPIHTNIGTGSYPRRHEVATNPVLASGDPGVIRIPTVSDLWGRQTDGAAVTSMVAYEDIHLGMLGHGSGLAGGDRDVAALWGPDNHWRTSEPFYRLPTYLREADEETLRAYEDGLDGRDDSEDGTWFGVSPRDIRSNVYRTGTPAFARLTGDAVVDVLAREGFGKDDVTDLLWIEFKSPDYAGHAWGMDDPTMGDTLREVDNQIGRVKRALDEVVGPGEYMIAITADHGMQPLPEEVGGWRIQAGELEIDLVEEFGNVIEKVTPNDIHLRVEALDELGVDPEDIARFVGAYTLGDNVAADAPGRERVPSGRLDERLFAGAFTSDYLQALSPDDIAGLGEGRFAEADYVD